MHGQTHIKFIVFKCLGFTPNLVQPKATSFAHQPLKHFSEQNVSDSMLQELRLIWTPDSRIMTHRFIEAYSVYNKRTGNQISNIKSSILMSR
jgi:hypothetical protein